tara:strand:+ start:118 stop:504 length:387 start_codon:yes stop_codon:yes gene_type:complete
MSSRYKAIKNGWRSGFEERIAKELKEAGVKYEYETKKIQYEIRELRKYTPDFILPNGIIVETKGRFVASDRKKHRLIKEQHPELDIRFVFYNATTKLYKGAKSTYADWCTKNGFMWANKTVPDEWIQE